MGAEKIKTHIAVFIGQAHLELITCGRVCLNSIERKCHRLTDARKSLNNEIEKEIEKDTRLVFQTNEAPPLRYKF